MEIYLYHQEFSIAHVLWILVLAFEDSGGGGVMLVEWVMDSEGVRIFHVGNGFYK